MTQTPSQNGATPTTAPAPAESFGPGQGAAPEAAFPSAQARLQEFNAVPRTRKPRQVKPPEKEEEQEPEGHESITTEQIATIFSKFSVTSGLAVAFIVLIVAIWMLIPTASGYTRLQLLWFTIIGQTQLTTKSNLSVGTIPEVPPGDTSQAPGQQQPFIPFTDQTNTNTSNNTTNNKDTQNSGPFMENVDFSALEWSGM